MWAHLRAMRAFGELRTAAAVPGRTNSAASGAAPNWSAASIAAKACCPAVQTLIACCLSAELASADFCVVDPMRKA
jgi:hypothetical protein